MNDELLSLSKTLGEALRGKGLKLKAAESFTGGAVSLMIIMTAGASEYFDEGIVCYSWDAKMHRLGVKKCDLQGFGAISLPIIKGMLKGLLDCGADIAVATTGNAGPLAGNGEVGECYVGVADKTRTMIKKFLFLSAEDKKTIDDGKIRQKIIDRGAKEAIKSIIEFITTA